MRVLFKLVNIVDSRPEYRNEHLTGKVKITLKMFDGLPPDEIYIEAPNWMMNENEALTSREKRARLRAQVDELRERLLYQNRGKSLNVRKREARDEVKRCFIVAEGRTEDIPLPPGSTPAPGSAPD